MYCIHCGSENPDQARFCTICGEHIEREQELTRPAVLSTNPDAASVSTAPLPSEQFWFGPPSEPSLVDAPTSIPDTPPPGQYAAPSSDAMLPVASEIISPPEMDITSAATYPTYPPVAALPAAQVETPGGVSEPSSGTPPTAPSSRFQTLAKPMPPLALICTLLLVAGIFIILFFSGSDWAAGALHLAIGAGIIAVLILAATVVRSFAGMASRANTKRVRQFVSTGMAFLLLMLLALAGFSQQSTIHSLQAHWFEGHQQWQQAINEYQLAGERAPASENIARIYNEWGDQLAGQQRYQEAFVKFDTVLNAFGSSAAQVNRAQTDEINAYIGWAKQAMDAKSYSDATQRYNELLQKPYCQANCRIRVDGLDATAYYDLAEFQLSAQNYTDAVNNFATVLSLFPSSPEATKLHGDYAQALYGEGRQQLTSVCSSAIPTYRQLASQFADTPQGQQAAAALKAPQPVKGRFVGVVPHANYLTDVATLIKGLYPNIPNTVFYNLLATSPQVVINSDGTFTFKPVAQGTYDLAWGTNNTADGAQSYGFYYLPSDNSLVYVANVGPLCPFDFGDIHEDIPTAQ